MALYRKIKLKVDVPKLKSMCSWWNNVYLYVSISHKFKAFIYMFLWIKDAIL